LEQETQVETTFLHHNAPIFSLIRHESSELHEFYKMYQEMEFFVVCLLESSVLQNCCKANNISKYQTNTKCLA
jgi:hypothetical protein